MPRTVVLDFDDAVQPIKGTIRVPLQEWQDRIRFGCRLSLLRDLGREIGTQVDEASTVFLGSGDYHHVSLLLIERMESLGRPIQVVVFDNHPDNMRYPFGIHCGSWVAHVSRLPFVSCVHVVGITSSDVEGAHVLENHLPSLRSGKVVYWCIGKRLKALRALGVRDSRSFESVSELLGRLGELSDEPIYLSIDKDVLSPAAAQTNWDQGVMQIEDLESAIRTLESRTVAADVVGEVSAYRYRSPFKRLLSRLDAQPVIEPASMKAAHAAHHEINQRLLSALRFG
jgi:arginase family enzyme